MNRREAIQQAGLILGYAISVPVLDGIMKGCTPKPGLTFNPEFLSSDQAQLVSVVSEIILPRTDTPGAIDAGVPGFIDSMLKDCYKKEDQDKFLAALKAFDDDATNEFGDAFNDLDPEQQGAYVLKVHKAAIDLAKSGEMKDRPFILTVKELTVTCFFISEAGATKVLTYNPVPGSFHGCEPV